jgi:hypothetical protein
MTNKPTPRTPLDHRTGHETASAAATYAARSGDIARLLDLLHAGLSKHAESAKARPADWGHAGDLGHVRGDLINLVAFLNGTDSKQVERLLAQPRG